MTQLTTTNYKYSCREVWALRASQPTMMECWCPVLCSTSGSHSCSDHDTMAVRAGRRMAVLQQCATHLPTSSPSSSVVFLSYLAWCSLSPGMGCTYSGHLGSCGLCCNSCLQPLMKASCSTNLKQWFWTGPWWLVWITDSAASGITLVASLDRLD